MLSFFLNGRLLPNNSVVLLSDIGEGSNALYCLTDRTQCCSRSAGASRGLWRSPDGDVQQNTNHDIYTSKGFSSLILNRRSSTVGPTGVYTCIIPSASDRARDSSTLRLEIYSSNEGKYAGCFFLRETIEGREGPREGRGGGGGGGGWRRAAWGGERGGGG